MKKMKQQNVYFFQINLISLMPSQSQIKKIQKNTLLNIILNKQSTEPMFISEYQNIAYLKALVKPFLYKGTISLGSQMLKFCVKSSDLSKNQTFLLKVFAINQGIQTQLTYFKFFVTKYIQAQLLQGISYFEQNFFQKSGSRISIQVYLQKNRAALQILIAQIQSQKRKKRSQSVKKRQNYGQKTLLTIQKLYKQTVQQKIIKKSHQRIQLSKSSNDKKRKLSKSIKEDKEFEESIPESIGVKTYNNEKKKQYNKNLTTSNNKHQHNLLQISKITEILNSEHYTENEKSNMQDSFSREIAKSRKTEPSSQKVLQELHFSHYVLPENQPISQIQQQSSQHTQNKRIISQINIQNSSEVQDPQGQISSVQPQTSSASRSFIDAIQLDSDQASSLAHSSEISARSELERLHKRKNNFCVSLLVIFAVFAIVFLMIPESSFNKIKIKKQKNYKK